jgi:phosphate/sulfate permease
MALSKRPERIWNDPPIPGDPPKGAVTLGANVPIEIKRMVVDIDTMHRRDRLVHTITLGLSFTTTYAIVSTMPFATTTTILTSFVLVSIILAAWELARYTRFI